MTYNDIIGLVSISISIASLAIVLISHAGISKISEDNKSLKAMYFDLLARVKVAIKTKDENQ
jgi:hypothetical protein